MLFQFTARGGRPTLYGRGALDDARSLCALMNANAAINNYEFAEIPKAPKTAKIIVLADAIADHRESRKHGGASVLRTFSHAHALAGDAAKPSALKSG